MANERRASNALVSTGSNAIAIAPSAAAGGPTAAVAAAAGPAHVVDTQEWRTVRVFISSTFRDTHGERDALTRKVFPRIRAWAAEQFITVIEIGHTDLRWGVTAAESSAGKTTMLCLAEIDRSDIFLGILGSRYGWVPPSYGLPESDPLYEWSRSYPLGRSITELEVCRATLNDRHQRAPCVKRSIFYFRDDTFLDSVPEHQKPVFVDGDTTATGVFVINATSQLLLKQLKARIEKSAKHDHTIHVSSYQCDFDDTLDSNQDELLGGSKTQVRGLDAWCDMVFKDLQAAISGIYPRSRQVTNQWEQERVSHRLYASRVASKVKGRTAETQACVDAVLTPADNKPVVVFGEAGVGKSAVMACVAMALAMHQSSDSAPSTPASAAAAAAKPKFALITHFVGATPGSDDLRTVLARLCVELRTVFQRHAAGARHGIASDHSDALQWALGSAPPPGPLRTLRNLFSSLLVCACHVVHVIVLLDGVDCIRTAQKAMSVDWLPVPSRCPSNLCFILSAAHTGHASSRCLLGSRTRPSHCMTTEDSVLDHLRRRGCHSVQLERLDSTSAQAMLAQELLAYGKKLDERQMAELLVRKDSRLPMYQAVVAEELRVFELYEGVLHRIRKLPNRLPELLKQFLKRLEVDHGGVLVQNAMCLILTAKDGLSEKELVALLDVPFTKWTGLHMSIRPYLSYQTVEASGAALTFSSKIIRNAVSAKYLEADLDDDDRRDSGAGGASQAGSEMDEARLERSTLFSQAPVIESKSARRFHIILAAFFACRGVGMPEEAAANAVRAIIPLNGKEIPALPTAWSTNWSCQGPDSVRALLSLVYHLLLGSRLKHACTVLCDLQYLFAVAKAGRLFDALDMILQAQSLLHLQRERRLAQLESMGRATANSDILAENPITARSHGVSTTTSMTKGKSKSLIREEFLAHVLQWLQSEVTILSRFPDLVLQSAANLPDMSLVVSAVVRDRAEGRHATPYLSWLNKPQHRNPCVMIMSAYAGPVWCVAYSPDGTLLASAHEDGIIRLWDTSSGDLQQVLDFAGSTSAATALAFRPEDSRWLISGTRDGRVLLWDYGACIGKELLYKAHAHGDYSRAHDAAVSCVAWHERGSYHISCDAAGVIVVWKWTVEAFEMSSSHSQPIAIHRWRAHDSGITACSMVPSACQTTILETGFRPAVTQGLTATSNKPAHASTTTSTSTSTFASVQHSAASQAVERPLDTYDRRNFAVLETIDSAREEEDAEDPDDAAAAAHERRLSLASDRADSVMNAESHNSSEESGDSDSDAALAPPMHRMGVTLFDAQIGLIVTCGTRAMSIWTCNNWDSPDAAVDRVGGASGQTTGIGHVQDAFLAVVCSSTMELRLLGTSRVDRFVLREPAGNLASVCSFSNSGRIGVGCTDGSVRVFVAETGQRVGVMTGHTAGVTSCCYSHDGSHLVTASTDGTVRVWAPSLLTRLAYRPCHAAPVTVAATAPWAASGLAATAAADGSVVVWSFGLSQPINRLMSRGRAVKALMFGEAPTSLHCTTQLGLRSWALGQDKSNSAVQRDSCDSTPVAFAISPAGSCFSLIHPVGNSDHPSGLSLFHTDNGKWVGLVTDSPLRDPSAAALSASFSPDGRLLAVATADGKLTLWDLGTVPKSNKVNSAVMFEPGKLYHKGRSSLAASAVCVLEDTRARLIAERVVSFIAFAPDALHLVCINGDQKLVLWSLQQAMMGPIHDGVPHAPDTAMHMFFGHVGTIHAAAWSPDARNLVSAGADGSLRLWDAHNVTLIRTFGGAKGAHGGAPVLQCEMSAHGRRIVSLGKDDTICLWDVDGPLVAVWVHRDHQFTCVRMSPLAGELVVGTRSGHVQLLRVVGDNTDNHPPIATIARMYYPERHMWHPKLTIRCASCGERCAPSSAAISAARGFQRNLQTYGPVPQYFQDQRLRCKCSRCKTLHRLNPFIVENPLSLGQESERLNLRLSPTVQQPSPSPRVPALPQAVSLPAIPTAAMVSNASVPLRKKPIALKKNHSVKLPRLGHQ